MASQGPNFPGTAVSLANAGSSENAEAWVNPGNIVSDNATEAAITAATYDSPDISQLLVASNFGFTVTGTINGVTVEVDRRSIIASSGKDFRVQLATGTAFANLVGSNKAVPATIWPSTTAVATYGGAADAWSASLTAAQVNDPGFAVMLSCQANIANADVGVDFIRVTVTYAPPVDTTVTPGVATLTTSRFAPVVSVTNNQLITPGAASLATIGFAPTVTATNHQIAIPDMLSLTLGTFAPVVTASDHKTITPAAASLSLTPFAPTVTATAGITVTAGVAALATTAFAPTFTASEHKIATPSTASLALTGLDPTVAITDHQNVAPSPRALSMTAFAPDVVASDHKLVTPATAELTTTTFAPAVGQPTEVVPSAALLSLTIFAPDVSLAGSMTVVPGPLALTLTGFAPVIGVSGGEVPLVAKRDVSLTIESTVVDATITWPSIEVES